MSEKSFLSPEIEIGFFLCRLFLTKWLQLLIHMIFESNTHHKKYLELPASNIFLKGQKH